MVPALAASRTRNICLVLFLGVAGMKPERFSLDIELQSHLKYTGALSSPSPK